MSTRTMSENDVHMKQPEPENIDIFDEVSDLSSRNTEQISSCWSINPFSELSLKIGEIWDELERKYKQ